MTDTPSETQDAAAAVETPEAPTQDTPAPEPEVALQEVEADIEEVASAELSGEVFESEEDYKGINYKEVVDELPDDAKKIIHNLRRSFTKKTMDIAEEKKQYENAKASLEAQRKSLMDSDFFNEVQEKAQKEISTFDPFDNKSFEERIEKEVAQRMTEMLEPMRKAQVLQEQQIRFQQFKDAHPDLDEVKQDVADLLVADKHLNLEQAYWQVKGKKLHDEMESQANELSKYKKAAKAAGLKIGGASRGRTNGIPKHVMDQDDPVAIYNWLKSNKKKTKI